MTYLGIDIGGTKVALRVEGEGRTAAEHSVRWPGPPAAVGTDLAVLAAAVRELRTGWDAPITAVGIALPATVAADGRVAAWPSRPTWSGLPVTATLAGLVPGARVRWADDGDLAALAEARAAGVPDAVYLGVGTGIGGGLVTAGRSTVESGRGSVEIGHMVIDRRGERCACGRAGCLQSIASGPATLARAAGGRGAAVSYERLREGWLAAGEWAVDAITESCDALAAAAVSLNEVLHPDAVIVGGGFAAGLPGYVDLVRRRAEHWARPGHPPPAIRPALLAGLSSLHGAVHLARAATG
ncbi:ROK family protein [Dactylosporangium sp. CA-092794]|uniref:ROK family protein n=1 Tax=Dactylosporangium sp. CA-092794 TaxID=3239929 RepID=UPI003D8EEEEB